MAAAFNDMTGRLAHAVVSQRDFVANASHQLRTPLTGLASAARGRRAQVAGSRPSGASSRLPSARPSGSPSLLNGLLALARERTRPPAAPPLAAGAGAGRGGRALGGAGGAQGPAARSWICDPERRSPGGARGPRDRGRQPDRERRSSTRPPDTAIEVEARLDRRPGPHRRQRPAAPACRPARSERVFERFFRGSAAGIARRGIGPGPRDRACARRALGRDGVDRAIARRAGRAPRCRFRLRPWPAALLYRRPDRELDEALPGRG